MKETVLNVYKPKGMTPYQAIESLRRHYPVYEKARLGYAGRLDPMAEGVLLILVDEENKKRKTYERLPKRYEFDIFLGIETDTYDVLGIVKQVRLSRVPGVKHLIPQHLHSFVGKWRQPYPPYSAARVNGKPLYYWAREGKLEGIVMPEKQIEVFSIELLHERDCIFDTLQQETVDRIRAVSGSFRQQEIQQCWKQVYETYRGHTVTVLSCTVSCSSGTYIRSLAHTLGVNIGTGAIAWSIKRTAVGDFMEKQALSIIT